jgi:hypothetical protein
MRHRCPISSDLVRQRPGARIFLRLAITVALVSLSIPAWAFQTQPRAGAPAQGAPAQRKSAPNSPSSRTERPAPQTAPEANLGWLQDALANPELMAEVARLVEKLRNGVQYPAAWHRSAILPRLPEGTMFFAALPNYGEPAYQALQIFRQELKESPQLQDFLRKNQLEATEPKIEEAVEKFYEFSQFLGDEFVIEGRLKGQDPSGVLVAEIKKPGLREFLDKLNNEIFTSQSDRLRILDPQQLASAGEKDAAHAPVVLIRADLIAVSFNVASLREFSSQIDDHGPRFASSALGQRLAQAYQEGANSVIGLDLHKLIGLIPLTKPQDKAMLEKTGFGDVNYLVASYTMSAARSTNQSELTFNGPRRGIASWIAAPKTMGGLDFVSTHPAFAADLILKSPPQIFDDLRDLMGETAFASLPQMEAQFNINLKRDLLGKLGGEIAFETQPMTLPGAPQATSFNQGAMAPKPGPFKVILSVSDPAGLQQTFANLLATAPVRTGQRQEDGVTFNTVTLPSQSDPVEINYFFLDGFLVIASDRATAREAARVHRSGESLAKSGKLREALLRRSLNASMIMYQDAGRMLAPVLAQLPPELSQLVSAGGATQLKPTVVSVFADENAFHAFSNADGQVNVSLPLIVAAVAIPSLMRSRIENGSSGAASAIRTVNTAQATYSSTYPEQGYAPNLATLGPGANGVCGANGHTATQACLLDNSLAGAGCTAGKWCEKDGYKFMIRAVCMQARCFNYAVTATPIASSTTAQSFCSTSDMVIRSHAGAPLDTPLTATECKTWPPSR